MLRFALLSDYEDSLTQTRDDMVKAIGEENVGLISPIIKTRYDIPGFEDMEMFITHVSIGERNEHDMQVSGYAEMRLFGKPADEDNIEKYMDCTVEMYLA